MNSSQSLHQAYEQLVGKPLTPEQVAEIKFNLGLYIELLTEMDRQQSGNATDSSEEPTEAID